VPRLPFLAFQSKPSVEYVIRLKRSAHTRRFLERGPMWLLIAVLFLIAWLVAFLAFHVAMAGIHILLGLFVVCVIIHFVRAARA
jgi:uncharacterized membrane protein YGL010W